ncbi:MAG: TolB protein [Thermoleophilaceae bacterium]|jgi:WD40 repeat protein|nr:TolB protein [Thermoleophilaceae bacterium]
MSAMKLFRRAFPIAALLACVLSPAAAQATWPGKPGLVAYWALDGVHTIRPDGTHDRLLFEHMTGNLFAWSPNGRELGLGGSNVVWRARPDGTHSHLIRGSGFGGDDPDVLSPAWGPKGDRLVFTAAYRHYGDPPEHINPTIWSVRRNGTQLRKLARGTEAVWSRSGAHIRFIDEGYDIVEINADGSGRRVLAHNSDSSDARSLDLSPDGKRLVYQTGYEDGPTFRTLNVRNGARTKFSLGKFGIREVVWAPGGKRLAYIFRASPDKRFELRTIRPDGHGVRKVLTFPESDWVHDLAWQTR